MWESEAFPARLAVTVAEKFASLPSAAASSFRVSSAAGEDATKLATDVDTNAVVATWVVFAPAAAVGAAGTPVNVGLARSAFVPRATPTKAVVATWVVFVPGAAVGAAGAPVNVGLARSALSAKEDAKAAFVGSAASFEKSPGGYAPALVAVASGNEPDVPELDAIVRLAGAAVTEMFVAPVAADQSVHAEPVQ